MRFLIPALLLLVLLGGGAGAEEESRYAREQLLADATRAVRPERLVAEDLEALRSALQEDRRLLGVPAGSAGPEEAALRAALAVTVEARIQFLGRPTETPDGRVQWGDAALRGARWIYHWLLGQAECGVLVGPDEGAAAEGAGQTYEWPPGPPTGEAPAEPPPTSLDAWAVWVQRSEGGSLLRRRITPAACHPLGDLLQAARNVPAYLPEEFGEVQRTNVIVDASGAFFDVNEPFLRLRALKSAELVETYSKDAPTQGLVDESTAQEKQRRHADLLERIAVLRVRRAAVHDDLRELATERWDFWRRVLGLLAVQLEAQRRAAPSAGTEAPDAAVSLARLRRRLLEARETTALLDLRLLYFAALRADVRLKLLDRWIAQLEGESLAAQGAASRYGAELLRRRREQQLGRLEFERETRIEGDLREVAEDLARSSATPGDDAAARRAAAVALARSAVLERLRTLNDLALAVVRGRRAAQERISVLAPTKPGTERSGTEPSADPLAALRNPERAPFDVQYVQAALAKLRDPSLEQAFDADLVARHYTSADAHLAATRAALRQISELLPLRARFDAQVAATEQALQALGTLQDLYVPYWVRRSRESVGLHRVEFEEASQGLAAFGVELREREALLDRYRKALLSAGERSFQIRVHRAVTPETLTQALDGVGGTVERVAAWATLESPQHAGHFLAEHGLGLLALAAAAVLAFLLVRRGKLLLDRAIDRRLAVDARLGGEVVGLGAERAADQENRQRQDAAVRAVEASVLAQAAGEEAPPDPAADAAAESASDAQGKPDPKGKA